MKLFSPFPQSSIVQHFGDNAVPLYQQGLGLKGHPGIDFGKPWGTPIPAAIDAYCYATLAKDNPNLAFYRAVCTIVDCGNLSYEIVYGHCSQILINAGEWVKAGQIVANIGNTGTVFSGGVEVTEAAKEAGSRAGAHLHFQVRLLEKELAAVPTDPNKHYVNDGNGLATINGYHYYVPNFDNGYNGCIDPAPFFNTFAFDKNLFFGMVGMDVAQLQKRLGVLSTGFFGPLTFAAVRKYQAANGVPSTGFVGPLTRLALNTTL